jgi:hypothetical protein
MLLSYGTTSRSRPDVVVVLTSLFRTTYMTYANVVFVARDCFDTQHSNLFCLFVVSRITTTARSSLIVLVILEDQVLYEWGMFWPEIVFLRQMLLYFILFNFSNGLNSCFILFYLTFLTVYNMNFNLKIHRFVISMRICYLILVHVLPIIVLIIDNYCCMYPYCWHMFCHLLWYYLTIIVVLSPILVHALPFIVILFDNHCCINPYFGTCFANYCDIIVVLTPILVHVLPIIVISLLY